jgi:cytochrome c oxidase subunit 6a
LDSVAIPALLIASANAYRLWNEHWEHVAHGPPKEEKPAYPYLNIRTKNFFWGDGDKVMLFSSDNTPCGILTALRRPCSGIPT